MSFKPQKTTLANELVNLEFMSEKTNVDAHRKVLLYRF